MLALIVLWPMAARATDPAPAPQAAIPPGPMGEREITVANKTKQAINELYVSPTHSDDWGDDRLGDDTLDAGETFRVRLGRMRECGFDVHVVYEDGSKEESLNNNVCRTRQLAFDGSNAVAPPPGEAHSVMIVNASSRPIQMVFISPAESNDWGDDRLTDDSISVGGSKSVTYRGDCAADLRVVFDNRSAEERKGLNLCETPRISIQPGWTTADTVPTGSPQVKPGLTGPLMITPIAPSTPASPPPASPPAPVQHQGPTLDVTVVNHSGRDAVELYLFPQTLTERGADRLGATVLKNNARLSLRIPKDNPGGDGCHFNAHIVYAGKTQDADLKGLDLCASPEVTLPP
jgi:hypothetical protein